MKKTDDLTLLAKSLTKSERKYFSLLSTLEGSKDTKLYLELFNSMVDEKGLKAGKKISGNAEYVLRNYLYNQLLFTLREYIEEETNEMQVDKQVLNVRVLVAKGQFNLAKKELNKILKHVRESEMFAHEMELLGIKHEFLSRLIYDKGEGVTFDILVKEELETADKYKNFRLYFQLYNNIRQLMITKGGRTLTDAEQKNLRAHIGHPLLRTELNALSLKAKYFFYLTWQYYYQAEGDVTALYRTTTKLIKFCNNNKPFMLLRPFQHLSAIYTHLQAAYDTGNMQEFAAGIEQMKQIKLASNIQQQYRQAYVLYHAYLLAFSKGKVGELNDLNSAYAKQREVLYNTIRKDFIMILDLNAMMLKMQQGDWKQLAEMANNFLNDKHFSVRTDFTAKVTLLHILAQFEMKNELILEYLARNTASFIKKQSGLKHEARLLQWLKKHIDATLRKKILNKEITISVIEYLESIDDDNPVYYKGWVQYIESTGGKKKR
jgi:hypothetical protein